MTPESSLPPIQEMPDEFQPAGVVETNGSKKWFAINRGLAMVIIAVIVLGSVIGEIVMRSTTGDSLGLDLSQNIAIGLASVAALADSSSR